MLYCNEDAVLSNDLARAVGAAVERDAGREAVAEAVHRPLHVAEDAVDVGVSGLAVGRNGRHSGDHSIKKAGAGGVTGIWTGAARPDS